MDIFKKLQSLSDNLLSQLSDSPFALGPQYKPEISEDKIRNSPLSLIIGEHPSEYSVSPLMWNAEFQLRQAPDLFLPFDIAPSRREALRLLLTLAFKEGGKYFRVLTITNPYKIEALDYFKTLKQQYPKRIVIAPEAERIGATNQILIGQDNVFHVINSDGAGMANSVEAFLAEKTESLAEKKVGIIGAGGAARGIIYEMSKRLAITGTGSVTVFNRTFEKAQQVVREFKKYFDYLPLRAEPLEQLKEKAPEYDILISSIDKGDPIGDYDAYEHLRRGMLIVDANYGKNSTIKQKAHEAGRDDLAIRDGAGMVVEGYIIPSRKLAQLWGYPAIEQIYGIVGDLFGYKPK